MSSDNMQAVDVAKRRDDKYLTIRLVLDACIVIIGFWLGNTILTINSTLREHDKEITAINTRMDERTKMRDEQMSTLKQNGVEMKNSLELAINKLELKVDKLDKLEMEISKIADKVGVKP